MATVARSWAETSPKTLRRKPWRNATACEPLYDSRSVDQTCDEARWMRYGSSNELFWRTSGLGLGVGVSLCTWPGGSSGFFTAAIDDGGTETSSLWGRACSTSDFARANASFTIFARPLASSVRGGRPNLAMATSRFCSLSARADEISRVDKPLP